MTCAHPGSPDAPRRYVRHRDAFVPSAAAAEQAASAQAACPSGRAVTVLYYLNPEWRAEHGGCLRVFRPSGCAGAAETSVDIAPMADRLVLFRRYVSARAGGRRGSMCGDGDLHARVRARAQ